VFEVNLLSEPFLSQDPSHSAYFAFGNQVLWHWIAPETVGYAVDLLLTNTWENTPPLFG
jgi:hypothetical protein